MTQPSVILLSCVNNVLLVPMIRACREAGVALEAVLMDGELPAKGVQILKERMGPGFEVAGLGQVNDPQLPFYFVHDHNSAAVVQRIAAMSSDYLINAGTPRILKTPVLTVKKGVLNCHPGILPRYRGCTCVEWALYNGDPVGASVHFMSEGIDEGPLVLTEAMPLEGMASYEEVRREMVMFMARLMARGIRQCHERGLTPAMLPPQPSGGQYHKPIDAGRMAAVRDRFSRVKGCARDIS